MWICFYIYIYNKYGWNASGKTCWRISKSTSEIIEKFLCRNFLYVSFLLSVKTYKNEFYSDNQLSFVSFWVAYVLNCAENSLLSTSSKLRNFRVNCNKWNNIYTICVKTVLFLSNCSSIYEQNKYIRVEVKRVQGYKWLIANFFFLFLRPRFRNFCHTNNTPAIIIHFGTRAP